MKFFCQTTLIACAGFFSWTLATPKDGLRIFTEAASRDAGYQDLKADIAMTLKDKSGSESFRSMRISNFEGKPGEFKSTLVFDKPLDVQGTALLTHSSDKLASDQWIYLPAFKRVKKISDANKTASFLGSEFSYEDINAINIQVAKFRYSLIAATDSIGVGCWKIERIPLDPNSGYKRQVVWIDSVDFTVKRIEFYNREGKFLKRLTIMGYEKFLNKFWRPKEMRMENFENGKSTLLAWSGYRFKTGLKEKDFDVTVLKRE